MRHPLYNLVLIQIRVARTEALEGVGMSEEEYAEVRDAWRAWKEGEEIDPELAAAFEQRKDELAEIELGKLEAIDN